MNARIRELVTKERAAYMKDMVDRLWKFMASRQGATLYDTLMESYADLHIYNLLSRDLGLPQLTFEDLMDYAQTEHKIASGA